MGFVHDCTIFTIYSVFVFKIYVIPLLVSSNLRDFYHHAARYTAVQNMCENPEVGHNNAICT